MLKWFTPLLLIICPLVSYGQFGANIKYQIGQSKTLDEVHFSQDGMQASLEYGFRLKQKRLEFHPGIGYRFTWNKDALEGYFNSIDLDLNTSIYPFDFAGDCHCPTFSKDGELFKKGFFLEISPGIAYQTLHRTKFMSDVYPFPTERVNITSNEVIFKIGAAAGLDIGLSEQLTLTPMVSMTWLSSKEWEGLNRTYSDLITLDDYSYIGAGLRLAYKPDPKRRRRF